MINNEFEQNNTWNEWSQLQHKLEKLSSSTNSQYMNENFEEVKARMRSRR